MSRVPRPLFRDPIFDGAADPVVVWNRQLREWWMFYTNRRAWAAPIDDVSWVHGTDIGIASSSDGGETWLYRGLAEGLPTQPGRHTYWAPEIVDDGHTYHMYVSYIVGVPTRWSGNARTIRHYTSSDLMTWDYVADLQLTSPRVIDSCVYPLPTGGYRMWFKDEQRGSHTYAADSTDLYEWTAIEDAVLDHVAHEGPNVFSLNGWYWMIIDEWCGQRVFRSSDLAAWDDQGLILDASGVGTDDAGPGFHADVVVVGDRALVFYFTHPGREGEVRDDLYSHRRSSIQVAAARVVDGRLVCDRDEVLTTPLLPLSGPYAGDVVGG